MTECVAHKWRAINQAEEGIRTFEERICWLCGARKIVTLIPDDLGELECEPHTLNLRIETEEWVLEYHDPYKLQVHLTPHPLHRE